MKIREYKYIDFGEGMRCCPEEGIAYQVDTSVSVKYGEDYWDNYIDYEQSSIADALNKFRTNLAQKYCSWVLDIGIGCGTFISRLQIPAYGYDINPKGVAWLKERGIYCDPYEKIPGEVNGITLFDVIEHIPDPDDLLNRIPIGVYVITSIPIFERLEEIWTSKHMKMNEHYIYFTENGLKIYMKDMGFQAIASGLPDESLIGRQGIKTFVFQKPALSFPERP